MYMLKVVSSEYNLFCRTASLLVIKIRSGHGTSTKTDCLSALKIIHSLGLFLRFNYLYATCEL